MDTVSWRNNVSITLTDHTKDIVFLCASDNCLGTILFLCDMEFYLANAIF